MPVVKETALAQLVDMKINGVSPEKPTNGSRDVSTVIMLAKALKFFIQIFTYIYKKKRITFKKFVTAFVTADKFLSKSFQGYICLIYKEDLQINFLFLFGHVFLGYLTYFNFVWTHFTHA